MKYALLLPIATVLLLALTAALTGCAGHNPEEDPDSFEAVKDIHGGPYSDMMLVYLKTGPKGKKGDITPEESAEVFKGHMANINRLADAGVLLVAGPFNKPRDKDWRGIFVLDTSSVQLAKLQADTDPGIQAGVFIAQYQPIKASITMRSSGELEKAMLAKNAEATEAAKAAPKDTTKPPPNLRTYVMLTADDAVAATAALAKAGMTNKVVWCAKFSGGTKSNPDRGAVFVLDATKTEEVQAAFEKAGVPTTGLNLDAWMSTASLMGFEPAARKLP